MSLRHTALYVPTAIAGQNIAVGQTTESNVAQAITVVVGAVSILLGQPSETNAAQVVTPISSINQVVNQVVETDLSQAITVSSTLSVSVNQVVETNLSQSISVVLGTTNVSVNQVVETNLSQSISVVLGTTNVLVNQIFETDLSQSIVGLESIAREASRTSGIAPLSVVFLAGFSVSFDSNRDFSDLEYIWGFDDTGSGTWPDSGKPRNVDKGPVASHVFEDGGTYTVDLTIKDASGSILDTDTFEITVTAEDTHYSTTNTTVVNKIGDSDFTGKPTGAAEVNADDLDDLLVYDGADKRIQLKRGSEWDYSGTLAFEKADTFHFGAYGTGTGEDSRGIFSNAPVINYTGAGDFIDISDRHDFRFVDITLIGESTGTVISGATDIRQLLLLRIKTTNFSAPIGWSHWRENSTDRIFENSIISCDIFNGNSYNLYIGGERVVLMGTDAHDSKVSHNCRIWNAYQSVVKHDVLAGASYDTANGRHALKFHGPKESEVGTYAETGGGGLPERTNFAVIADNLIGNSGPWACTVGAQDSVADQRVTDVIVEKNRFFTEYGTQSSTKVQVSLMLGGNYNIGRNNVFDGSLGSNSYTGIWINRRGIEPAPSHIQLYNNTMYNSDIAANFAEAIDVHSSALNIDIRNTFASFPNTSTTRMIDDHTSGGVTESNNQLNDTNGFVDPDNVVPIDRDFSLLVGAPAIDAGISVEVADDFDGIARTGTFEQGAYIFIAGANVNQVAEADLAQVIGVMGGLLTIAVNQVVETDLSQLISVTGSLSIVTNQVIETDVSQVIEFIETTPVGQVSENDLSQMIVLATGAVSISVDQVIEIDLSQVITFAPTVGTIVQTFLSPVDTGIVVQNYSPVGGITLI